MLALAAKPTDLVFDVGLGIDRGAGHALLTELKRKSPHVNAIQQFRALWSPVVIGHAGPERDLAALVVPGSGQLVATGNRYEPYRLLDPNGVPVVAVTVHFQDLLAVGRAELTVRSYGMDLLRWFRFL